VAERGEVRLEILVDDAPLAGASFLALARKGFYDGLTFHRVVPNWVVQGGDPRGDGWGDAGFALPDEPGPRPFLRGSVGIAKLDRNDGGCQFFITHLPAPRLDGRFTLFAQVIEGMDVVDRIEEGDVIESIRIDAWPPSGKGSR
jgi:cyclophilin family peptidyl-prolyl cis-trans isomerase